MNESIIEFKIKGYLIRIDKNLISVCNNNELVLKVNYLQINAIVKWLIAKVNELKDLPEVKSLEQ
jgi:hypothetical protein